MEQQLSAIQMLMRFQATGDAAGLEALLLHRDSTEVLLAALPSAFPTEQFASVSAQETWEQVARATEKYRGPNDALALYVALYEQMLRYEGVTGQRVHKGMPLVWISECHAALGHPVLSKRFLMLTLVEDAVRDGGVVKPTEGVYFRAVWRHGMSPPEVQRYADLAAKLAASDEAGRFPEWVLQQLDDRWLAEYPSGAESCVYAANRLYIRWLLDRCGDVGGRYLESLGQYIVSAMPGCRARKEKSHSTDYDIMCCTEGPQYDFRSEFGRYFVCECKDWSLPADFTAVAKFCRVLDSIKCRFGILFSREGITGASHTTDAAREQVKVFQDRGLVIVVVDRSDLERLAEGSNFISLLRSKYEAVRMDLRSQTALSGRRVARRSQPRGSRSRRSPP